MDEVSGPGIGIMQYLYTCHFGIDASLPRTGSIWHAECVQSDSTWRQLIDMRSVSES